MIITSLCSLLPRLTSFHDNSLESMAASLREAWLLCDYPDIPDKLVSRLLGPKMLNSLHDNRLFASSHSIYIWMRHWDPSHTCKMGGLVSEQLFYCRIRWASLVPRPIRKRAWYPLFAHVLNFPTFREFGLYRNTSVCRDIYVYIALYLSVHCWLTICMQDDSAVLYALLWLKRRSESTKTRKESIYEVFILAAYGFWKVISRVTKL